MNTMLVTMLMLLAGAPVGEAHQVWVRGNGHMERARAEGTVRKDQPDQDKSTPTQKKASNLPVVTVVDKDDEDSAVAPDQVPSAPEEVDQAIQEKPIQILQGFHERPAYLGHVMLAVICIMLLAAWLRAFVVPNVLATPAATTSMGFWFEMKSSLGDLPMCLSAWCSGLLIIDLAGTAPEANVLVLPEFKPEAFGNVAACRLLCLLSCVACAVLGPFARWYHVVDLANKCSWLILGITWFFLTQALVFEREFHSVFVPAWTVIGCSLVMVFEGCMRPGLEFSFLQKFVLMNVACSHFNSGILKVASDGLFWDMTFIIDATSQRAILGGLMHMFNDSVLLGLKFGQIMGAIAVVFELVLPPIAVFVPAFRTSWYITCFAFHSLTYLLLGVNFSQQAWCMCILIGIPQLMSWSEAKKSSTLDGNASPIDGNTAPIDGSNADVMSRAGEYVMQAVGYLVVVMWIYALFDDRFASLHFLTSDMALFPNRPTPP